MRHLVLIAHNLRSCHNVGSLLRTAEGLGVERVILSGYTPHPARPNDTRLPHEAAKLTKQIHKTALSAEDLVPWEFRPDVAQVIVELQQAGYVVAAVEQAAQSVKLPGYQPPEKLALLVGREVEGVEPEVLAACDLALEIPMFGQKESFNVVQAAAMALFYCRFARA
ncbi:MAG TPA: TrmH family RNA methyltransferase [Candidatus Saccharimonadales bacterium]|nr:TrmH family RNA methyltransferase [Candidatus Saccharimonadales bacterium]